MSCSPLQIEGLLDDIDFKAKVSRLDFEELCPDLFQRVAEPVQQALASAEISLVGVRVSCSVQSRQRETPY